MSEHSHYNEAIYTLDDTQLLSRCRIEKYSARGPGGQHQQRHASAVRLRFDEFNIVVQCQDFRNAGDNQKRALAEMRLQLACKIRGCADETWLSDFSSGKQLQVSNNNKRYYLVCAVLLDALAAESFDVAKAAIQIGSTSSQIIKVLKQHKYVWTLVQNERRDRGLKELR